jgi:hypothetical protein
MTSIADERLAAHVLDLSDHMDRVKRMLGGLTGD